MEFSPSRCSTCLQIWVWTAAFVDRTEQFKRSVVQIIWEQISGNHLNFHTSEKNTHLQGNAFPISVFHYHFWKKSP